MKNKQKCNSFFKILSFRIQKVLSGKVLRGGGTENFMFPRHAEPPRHHFSSYAGIEKEKKKKKYKPQLPAARARWPQHLTSWATVLAWITNLDSFPHTASPASRGGFISSILCSLGKVFSVYIYTLIRGSPMGQNSRAVLTLLCQPHWRCYQHTATVNYPG